MFAVVKNLPKAVMPAPAPGKKTKKAAAGGKSKSGKKVGSGKPKTKGAPKGAAGSGTKAARALSASPKKKKPA